MNTNSFSFRNKFVINIMKIIIIFFVSLVVIGCSKDSDNDSGSSIPPAPIEKKPVITADNSPITLTLTEGQNILVGGGALKIEIIDSIGSLIDKWYNKPKVVNLLAGKYIISAKESTNKYDNSVGIYINLVEQFSVDSLPLNKTTSIPLRSAKLYKLNLDKDALFYIDASRSDVHVYDNKLNLIFTFSSTTPGDPEHFLSLGLGQYYVDVDTNTFVVEGSFIFQELGL